MAHANHCSSNKRPFLASFAVLFLAGCAGQSSLLGDDLRLSIFDQKNDVRIITPAAAPELKTTVVNTAGATVNTHTKTTHPDHAQLKRPAWCDYLMEDTAAQTTVMRSPRLTGSVDEDGSANVSLGMSLSDYTKANVLEETAEARCRRYMAEKGLTKLVFLSPQGLTSAGFRAKAKAIYSRKQDIAALRRQINAAMNNGDIERERATVLSGLADQLMYEAGDAKSQADRRTADLLGQKDKASVMGRELLRAEADLEDLNSRMRTIDSFDVSVSAGWSEDLSKNNFSMNKEDFGGKVSLSWKIGSALPSRFEHEQAAKEAKLRALGDEGGTLWQVNVLRLAHERAIEGLQQSTSRIDDAISETRKLLRSLDGVDAPEFQAVRIGAKLKLLQLNADKAAVDGSIAEIRTNMKRLNTAG
jgi:hypothetical protein